MTKILKISVSNNGVVSMDWKKLLQNVAAFITVLGAFSYFFRKTLETVKQTISSLNKKLRLARINKLRRQYFWFLSIENNQPLLISFVSRQVLFGLFIAITMLFIGFIFLYLDKSLYKLFGGFYMVLMYVLFIKHMDEVLDVLLGLKDPQNYKTEKRSKFRALRTKNIANKVRR